MTAKIISDHHERQQDKENRQRLSNKNVTQTKSADPLNSKRTKTSESQRQTIVPQMSKPISAASSNQV